MGGGTGPGGETEPVVIELAEALELLERAVAEKGADYEYRSPTGSACVYTYDGKPSCILGHALSYKGVVVPEATSGLVYNWNDQRIEHVAHTVALAQGVWLSPGAWLVWSAAQEVQDGGASWGSAVAAAKQAARAAGLLNEVA